MSTSFRSLAVLALLSAVLLVACLSSVSSAPSPALWRHVGRANDLSAPIRLTIGVKQRNVDALLQTLSAVSTPSSPTYRQHLSLDALNSLLTPHPSSISAITTWLTSAGVAPSSIRRTSNGEWLSVDTTLAVAERLLSAEYHAYRHAQVDGVEVLRCQSYSLPASVRDAIDVIGPTTRFPAYHTPAARLLPALTRQTADKGPAGVYWDGKEEADAVVTDCSDTCPITAAPPRSAQQDPCNPRLIDPDCIRAAYGVGNASVSHNASGAVNGFLEQYISLKDLDTFFQKFDPTQVGQRPTIIGPNDETKPGVEASLDIQSPSTAHNPAYHQITSVCPATHPALSFSAFCVGT